MMLVFVTCQDGELRCYEVDSENVNIILSEAMERDAKFYPDKKANWANFEIVRGKSVLAVANGEIV